MALKQGRCRNYGSCRLADERVLQKVDDAAGFVCGNPECRAPLAESLGTSGPPDSARRRGILLIAGAVFLAMLVGGSGYYFSRLSATGTAVATGISNIPHKPMEQWIGEFATSAVQNPESLAPSEYRQALEAAGRINARSATIQALKQAGKLVGSESGLLNPVQGIELAPEERGLLGDENQDRRVLFAFIAGNSSPEVSYERVADEYARNQWREWPLP